MSRAPDARTDEQRRAGETLRAEARRLAQDRDDRAEMRSVREELAELAIEPPTRTQQV
jgi:hypothetical protein